MKWGTVLDCWSNTTSGGTEPGCIARSPGGDPEHKVVINENSRRQRGAALCPSGEASCQGSALQEWQTDRRI